MRIEFCGANRTVTGSCHLVEANGLRLLLDVGMFQGPREEARRLNRLLPEGARGVDAVILSHGHLDHCGKLPVLARHGYAGPIYCTPPTADVARIVLMDSAEIQVEDAAYLNRRARGETGRQDPVEALYGPPDVHKVLRLFRRVPYGRPTDLGRGVSFTFHDAGHILGSAYVVLEWSEAGRPRSLLFTADVGRPGTPLLRDPHPLPGPFDVVITESTYGDRAHAPMADVEPQLRAAVRHCAERQSRLLIPAFAVGRTQTILWYLHKFAADGSAPAIPVFVDSPMGVEVTRAHAEHAGEFDDETRALLKATAELFDDDARHAATGGGAHVTFATSVQESMRINGVRGACAIIASSPTLEFGRILHHLKRSVERPDDVVLFTGWTPPHTLGRRLQERAAKVRIYDRWYEPRCDVRTIHGLSAHADADELLAFLGPTLSPQTTAYVVHGEPAESEGFARRLVSAGMGNAVVPATATAAHAFGAVEPAGPPKPAETLGRTDGD